MLLKKLKCPPREFQLIFKLRKIYRVTCFSSDMKICCTTILKLSFVSCESTFTNIMKAVILQGKIKREKIKNQNKINDLVLLFRLRFRESCSDMLSCRNAFHPVEMYNYLFHEGVKINTSNKIDTKVYCAKNSKKLFYFC